MPSINNCCITALLAKLVEFMQISCNCCGNGNTEAGGSPVGAVRYFAMPQAPNGWLECDGTEVAIQDYPALFSTIGDTYGTSSNSNEFFKLPDLRGEFLRGFDNGRSIDEERKFASFQEGTVVTGDSDNTATPISLYDKTSNYPGKYSADKIASSTYNIDNFEGTQSTFHSNITANPYKQYFGITRPRNIALLTCIKY